jgi:hypothetical protein
VKTIERKNLSKTPAPKADRIKGSSKNPKGSASSTERANKINLSESIITTLENKRGEYNKKHPNNNKVALGTLKAVFRRGAGAYSTSHRPTITGGAPNSRSAWAFARVNKFLLKKGGTKVKKAYVQDDDLMEEGGDLGQEITCVNCGWHWNTNQSDVSDKYVCHKCGFDNRTFYDSDPIGKYHLGGDMSKHLAPNGKPSNLTHEQWHLVRTPEFKAWFGDWENDPENASKVVDENGEPMVVYHGTKYEFFTFRDDKLIWSTPEIEYIDEMKGMLKSTRVIKLFANSRNILDFSQYGYKYYDQQTAYNIFLEYGIKLSGILNQRTGSIFYTYLQNHNKELKEQMNKLGYDGIKAKVHRNYDFAFAFLYPNQIKLADGSNTTFDANNPDIRYEGGGILDETYNKVLQGSINSDDGAIFLDENGIEVTDEIYDMLRNAETESVKKSRGLQVGDIITVKGKYGNDDFKGNFRGYTNEGKLIVVYDGGKQMAISKDEYYAEGGKLKKPHNVIEIAEKHEVEVNKVIKALEKGIKKEKEHTTDYTTARTIALHHLWESPKYYDKLNKMEKELNIDEHYQDLKKIYAIGGTIDPTLSFATPSGEPSKLTYLQQVLVRTSAFKNWFGDWESSAIQFIANGRQNYDRLFKNVSKVIDKVTFEPKVVYHGTRTEKEFFIFDVSKEMGVGRPYGYFAHNIEYSQNFTTSSQRGAQNSIPLLYQCFVNVKNPFYAMGNEYVDQRGDAKYWKDLISLTVTTDKYPNESDKDRIDKIKNVVVSQIGTYIDKVYESQDSPFWLLMARDENKIFKYFLNNYKYDGVFYTEEIGYPYDIDNPAQFTEAVTIFEPSQVKLADGRNLNFDPMNNDIRYEDGGKTELPQNKMENFQHSSKIEKMRNLLTNSKYAEGGEVVANKLKDGNDGKKGGYFEGRSHAEGGIKAYNKDTGQMIEVEGEEVIITKGAVKDPQKREFEGEMLTNREILSRINQSGGGVSFAKGGEMESHKCGCSGKKYKYGGEMMDDYSIIKLMNQPFEIISTNFESARQFADMLVEKLK